MLRQDRNMPLPASGRELRRPAPLRQKLAREIGRMAKQSKL